MPDNLCPSCKAKVHPLLLLAKGQSRLCPECGHELFKVDYEPRLLERDCFVYLEAKQQQGFDHNQYAQCNTCINFTGVSCGIHGPDIKMYADSSCNLYVPGKPKAIYGEEFPFVNPEESGLVHMQVRCENCKHFEPVTKMCRLFELLTRIHKGTFSIDPYVKPFGCCNAFQPKYPDSGEY